MLTSGGIQNDIICAYTDPAGSRAICTHVNLRRTGWMTAQSERNFGCQSSKRCKLGSCAEMDRRHSLSRCARE
jgi:hypothetical protein